MAQEHIVSFDHCVVHVYQNSDGEVIIKVNPRVQEKEHLPLAYLLGSNMLIYTKHDNTDPKLRR